jgi:hypothetical protein
MGTRIEQIEQIWTDFLKNIRLNLFDLRFNHTLFWPTKKLRNNVTF